MLLPILLLAADLKLGIMGTDTSHAGAFATLLDGGKVPGAKSVAAYKGGSADIESSRTRVDKFSEELKTKYGVEFVDDIPTLAKKVDAILLTGGTGISSRDQTYETVRGLISKELPGYGELFRMLSFQEIGPAAILSRAVGGLLGQVVVLTMPGSPAGVRLALEKVILPELPHLVREARR